MRATEQLARRLKSERARGTRFKLQRKNEGKVQVQLWLSAADLRIADQLKVAMGAANRSTVVAAALQEKFRQVQIYRCLECDAPLADGREDDPLCAHCETATASGAVDLVETPH